MNMATAQLEAYRVIGSASTTLSTNILQYRLQRLSTGNDKTVVTPSCYLREKENEAPVGFDDNARRNKERRKINTRRNQEDEVEVEEESEIDLENHNGEYFNRLLTDFLFHCHDNGKEDNDLDAKRINYPEEMMSTQFLGNGANDIERNNLLLKNLIRLRHGLKFDEELQKQIFFEKLSFMVILLSPEKRKRPVDRKTWCFFPYHSKCLCDYKTTGCRKKRLLSESISRLEFFNQQYLKLKDSFKARGDQSLDRFYQQNEKFIKRFEERIRRRQEARRKRETRLLAISKFFDKVKKAKQEEGIKSYRTNAESAEQDELLRAEEHEKSKELQKQELLKRLKFVKFERVLPPIRQMKPLKNNNNNENNSDEDEIDEFTDQLAADDDNDVMFGISSEEEEEDESIHLPIIETRIVRNEQPLEIPTKEGSSALNKLRFIRSKNKHKTKKTATPKLTKKPTKLPPLDKVKKKLKIAMKRGNNVTSQPEMPSSSNASRHRNQKVSRNSRRRKNRKEISGDGEEGRSRMTIEDEKDVKVVLDEKEAEGQGDTQFLEVDLGKDYFVQQIVLEQKDKGKVLSRRQRRCSFTMSYSTDGSEWFHYNDPIGNPVSFRDEGDKPFSIHVLDDGLMTRYLRVYPTENPDRFQINETLLGVELKQDDEHKEKVKRHPKPKRTKRVMDTVVKPTRPSPLPPPKEVTPLPSQLEVGSNDEEIDETNDDEDDDVMEFDDFQDDLIVRSNSLLTNSGDEEKVATIQRRVSIFSINSIQEEAEKEELLQRLKAEEDAKREQEKLAQIARRNHLLSQKRHQIRKELEQKRRNQVSQPDNKNKGDVSHIKTEALNNFEFFDKYCLYTQEQLAWYQAIYDDIEHFEIGSKTDFLPLQAALDGLSIVNKSLVTGQDYNYIFTVLECFDIHVTDGMNFRTFSLIAAFSERIKTLRAFFSLPHNESSEDFDYPQIVPCLSRTKELYKIMLNRDEQTIDVADFLVEMQAARIAGEHDILRFILQNDVMEKLDFFDYLTFFPLFLYSHESIVAEDVLFA